MGGLIDRDEAPSILVWPVAQDYVIRHDVIYPKGWKADRYAPLQEPDLFLSFARLNAYGKASEGRIVNWIRKHGLLRRADPKSAGHHLTEDVWVPDGRGRLTVR